MLVGAAGAGDAPRGSALALVPEPESLGRGLLRDLDHRGLLHLGQLRRGLLRRGGAVGIAHGGTEVVLELLESCGVRVTNYLN